MEDKALNSEFRYQSDDAHVVIDIDQTERKRADSVKPVKEKAQKSFFQKILPVSSGLLTATNNCLECISFTSLLFSGMLAQFLPIGIKQMLIGMATTQMISAIFSGFTNAVFCLAWEAAPFIVLSTQGIVTELQTQKVDDDSIAGTVMFAYIFMALASSVVFLLVGSLGLGKVVNFVPFPVRTGLFASVGYLLYKMSWELATESDMSMDTLHKNWQLLLAAHIVGAVLFWLVYKFHHPATLPGLFFGGMVVFQLFLLISGKDAEWAREEKWLMEKSEAGPFWTFYTELFGYHIHWKAILNQYKHILIAILVGPLLNANINVVMLGPLLNTQPNQDKEMRVHGIANLVNGLMGGFTCNAAVSNTNLHLAAGGHTRSSVVIASIGTYMYFLVHYTFGLIPLIPRTIIAAFFVNFGIDFCYDALVVSAKKVSKWEYLIMLIILFTTIFDDVSIAFVVGILISFLLFVKRYSTIDHVMYETDNTQLCSCVLRQRSHNRELLTLAKRIKIFRLQGYIFFASVFSLTDHINKVIKNRIKAGEKTSYVVLDFSQVPGVDTTAMSAIMEMVKCLYEQEKISFVMVVNKDESLRARLGPTVEIPKITVHGVNSSRKERVDLTATIRRMDSSRSVASVNSGNYQSYSTYSNGLDTINEEIGENSMGPGHDLNTFLSLTEVVDNVVASHGNFNSKWNKWLPIIKLAKKKKHTKKRRHSFKHFVEEDEVQKTSEVQKRLQVFSNMDDALEYCEDCLLGIHNTSFYQAHRHSITKFVPHSGPELARWSGKWELWDSIRLFHLVSKHHRPAFFFDGKCPLLDTGLCRALYFRAGEVLFWEGDRSNGIYLLGNGRLTSYFTPYQDNVNIHDSDSVDRIRAFTQELSVTEFMPESKNRLWVARHPGTPLGNLNLDETGEVTRNDETVVAEVNTSVLHIPERALRILSNDAPKAYVELFRVVRRLQLRKLKFLKLKMKISDMMSDSAANDGVNMM
eukprot:TRINITY_DN6100_c0_g3_i4.p1 TRINITY_DN6100_c0_g3~~TRINITY_DN6100_c0_g3_i4.p1  ORF type:complete len:978 (-),score=302.55 TRINITY_DN6100_c0_g3_i4:690-3623(-)